MKAGPTRLSGENGWSSSAEAETPAGHRYIRKREPLKSTFAIPASLREKIKLLEMRGVHWIEA